MAVALSDEHSAARKPEMTPDDFVAEVVDCYVRARTPLREHPKVRRSESRSIASEVEDLLAYYLASRLSSLDEVFINQTLIVAGQPRFKPDLVLCHHSQIGALLDVKIDLGWKPGQSHLNPEEIEQ